MKTILLLDNLDETRRLYSVNLKAYTNASIKEFDDIDIASKFLEKHDFDIVIVRSMIHQRDVAKKIFQILAAKSINIPLIILGKTKLESDKIKVFDGQTALKEIVKTCASILGITAADMVQVDVTDYFPISLNLFLDGFELICPIYKLNEKNEYDLLLNKGQKIFKEVIVILKSVGQETIFVKSVDRLKFVSSLSIQLADMQNNDHISIDQKINFSDKGHQLVRESAKKMLIDNETIQLAEACMETMMSIARSVPKLKNLVELTFKNSTGLLYRHCLLINYICAHIISSMEWGTRDQQVKCSFVSFFHDLSLSNDEFLLIHSDEELHQANLSTKERERIDSHALLSAKFLSKYYRSIPMGADTIIKQHHGSRNGIGLSNMSQNISPLAIVFIVAEEWVTIILKAEQAEKELTRIELINKLKLKFKSYVAFSKVLKVLNKLII